MSYRAPDPTEKDREATAEMATARAEMARFESSLKASQRRTLLIVVGVVLGLMLVGTFSVITILGALGSGPSLSGTPGVSPRCPCLCRTAGRRGSRAAALIRHDPLTLTRAIQSLAS